MTLQALTYKSKDDNSIFALIQEINKGVSFKSFKEFIKNTSFSMKEWSSFLHLSERSLQRYEKENKSFEPLQSQQLVEIALLFSKGEEIFGTRKTFSLWLDTVSIALGHIQPKLLLTSTLGINLINDELTRIEHGVLA